MEDVPSEKGEDITGIVAPALVRSIGAMAGAAFC